MYTFQAFCFRLFLLYFCYTFSIIVINIFAIVIFDGFILVGGHDVLSHLFSGVIFYTKNKLSVPNNHAAFRLRKSCLYHARDS